MVITIVVVVLFLIISLSSLFFAFYVRDSVALRVPFIPTRTEATRIIIEAFDLQNADHLVDLGCGDGRILLESLRQNPHITATGIERGWIAYMVAKFTTRNSPAAIVYSDIANYNLSNATHIYCYLYTRVNQQLAPKIQRECKPGTRIISCDFEFPDWKPERVIIIPGSDTHALSKKLFVYTL